MEVTFKENDKTHFRLVENICKCHMQKEPSKFAGKNNKTNKNSKKV